MNEINRGIQKRMKQNKIDTPVIQHTVLYLIGINLHNQNMHIINLHNENTPLINLHNENTPIINIHNENTYIINLHDVNTHIINLHNENTHIIFALACPAIRSAE